MDEAQVTKEVAEVTDQTNEHIGNVRKFLLDIASDLTKRAEVHDLSKFKDPEWPLFLKFTPRLKDTTYGSEEYAGYLEQMKPALTHHYAVNSHHPEFHKNGVRDMTLCDLIEMICDWKAATMRHADGDLAKSLDINRERFNIPPEIESTMKLVVDHIAAVDEQASAAE